MKINQRQKIKKINLILASLILLLPILVIKPVAGAECEWIRKSYTQESREEIEKLQALCQKVSPDCCGQKPSGIFYPNIIICCPVALETRSPSEKTYESLTFTPQVKIPKSAFDKDKIVVGTYNAADKKVYTDLLAKYVKTIYDYGFGIAAILAALVLMGGGVLWLVSGGDSTKVTQAKDFIIGSVVGLIILACSWIILNTINPSLLNFKVLETNLIKNVGDSEPISDAGNLTNSDQCAICVAIRDIPCKDGCLANADLVEKLNQAKKNSGDISWIITEAYPPTSLHNSKCHYNGRCVDVAISPSTNPADCTKVNQLIQILKDAGLNVLNEYTTCNGAQTQYATGGHLHVQ
jgi:hypothetical protein